MLVEDLSLFGNSSTQWKRFFDEIERKVVGNDAIFAKDEYSRNEKGIELLIELPGVDKKDVNVQIRKGKLRITSDKKLGKEYKQENVYKINDGLDTTTLTATLKNGILKVSILFEKSKKDVDIEIK